MNSSATVGGGELNTAIERYVPFVWLNVCAAVGGCVVVQANDSPMTYSRESSEIIFLSPTMHVTWFDCTCVEDAP